MSKNHDYELTTKFKIAIFLTSITLVAEIVGGVLTNSLALLSDAIHVFLDLFALILSLVAVYLASLSTSGRHTFGFHRSEVLASLINGLTVFVMGVGILIEAWKRFFTPGHVESIPMLIIAMVGLLMNLLSAKVLHSHSHDDLNVKSAYLHVIGDAVASIGVIIGGLIMCFTSWYALDAIISAGIGLLILGSATRVLRDATHILMEGTPPDIDNKKVVTALTNIDGVESLHHLNIWAICSHISALSVHIVLKNSFQGEKAEILKNIEHLLKEQFHITHTTIQLDCGNCTETSLEKTFEHQQRVDPHLH